MLTNAIDGPALTLATGAVRLIDLALGPAAPRRPTRGDRRDADALPICRRSAGGSPTCGASSTSSPSAVGCTCSIRPPTIRSPNRRGSPSSTSGRCAIADAPGYASPGERLVYERDDDGRVRSVRGGSGSTSYPLDVVATAVAGRERVALGEPLVP